jgi:hypothetical protein
LPGLQLKMHRGSGSEIAEFLRSGAVELAIAGPLVETWWGSGPRFTFA